MQEIVGFLRVLFFVPQTRHLKMPLCICVCIFLGRTEGAINGLLRCAQPMKKSFA